MISVTCEYDSSTGVAKAIATQGNRRITLATSQARNALAKVRSRVKAPKFLDKALGEKKLSPDSVRFDWATHVAPYEFRGAGIQSQEAPFPSRKRDTSLFDAVAAALEDADDEGRFEHRKQYAFKGCAGVSYTRPDGGVIVDKATGEPIIYFEHKKQGFSGNAVERLFRYSYLFGQITSGRCTSVIFASGKGITNPKGSMRRTLGTLVTAFDKYMGRGRHSVFITDEEPDYYSTVQFCLHDVLKAA